MDLRPPLLTLPHRRRAVTAVVALAALGALLLATALADARGKPRRGRSDAPHVARAGRGHGHVPRHLIGPRRTLGPAAPAGTGPAAAPWSAPGTELSGAPALDPPAVADPATPPPVVAPPAVPSVGVAVDDTPAYVARLSRPSVPAGKVVVQLQNGGEDPHNLRIVRTDAAGDPVDLPETAPGGTASRTLTVAAGTYRLFCTLTAPVNHELAGMNATLTVTG